jgi:hypothetical protein
VERLDLLLVSNRHAARCAFEKKTTTMKKRRSTIPLQVRFSTCTRHGPFATRGRTRTLLMATTSSLYVNCKRETTFYKSCVVFATALLQPFPSTSTRDPQTGIKPTHYLILIIVHKSQSSDIPQLGRVDFALSSMCIKVKCYRVQQHVQSIH